MHYKVRLSVWRDEFKGLTNGKQPADEDDVIDLTEPTLVAAEDDDGEDKDDEDPQIKGASSQTASLPPASSVADDDGFDIDAVIRAEEERLATLRAATTDVGSPRPSRSPPLAEKAPSKSAPDANAMDVDEASLWEAFNDPPLSFDPPPSGPPPSASADDDDMWNIVDEIEQAERRKPAKTQIPVSGVNLEPSLDSTNSGNVSRATNDEDWDEMYS